MEFREPSQYSDGLWAGWLMFNFWQNQDFSRLHNIQTGPGAQLASYPMGTGAISPGIKWLGCEVDCSPPSSAEVKKGLAIPSLPHMSSWHSA
jgi:hypothetical protein